MRALILSLFFAGSASAAAVCDTTLMGLEPIDPMKSSGGTCRGACGPGCDTKHDCVPFTGMSCLDDSDGTHTSCQYTGFTCGSAQGCREHDNCYDACGTGGDVANFICKRKCDGICIAHYGLGQCLRWKKGLGPYDSEISYSSPPTAISSIPGMCGGSPDMGSPSPPAPDMSMIPKVCYTDAPGNHSAASVMDVCMNGHSPQGLDACTNYVGTCDAACGGPGRGSCQQTSCRGLGIPTTSAGGCGYDGYMDMPSYDVLCTCN